MSVWDCNKPSEYNQGNCGCLPAGFTRLRYYFGKHLGVSDFVDEQRYNVGKHRFHNQRLHGKGVLCGLKISLPNDDSASPTLLKVHRGAAIDSCGREIIVGFDQCIDVDAWFKAEYMRRYQADPLTTWPQNDWLGDGKVTFCVLIRYVETPRNPEPAPRDICNCAEGGCEYGRVSEEYELTLMTLSEAQTISEQHLFPSKNQIEKSLLDKEGRLDLIGGLSESILAGCPSDDTVKWLRLGCFVAKTENVITDPEARNTALDNGENPAGDVVSLEPTEVSEPPPILLSTETIQYLLANLYKDFEADDNAPHIIEVLWRKPDPGENRYHMILRLSGNVAENSISEQESFSLRQLGETGWTEPGERNVRTEYVSDFEGFGPALIVAIDNTRNFLTDGEIYHLYKATDIHPIVDNQLRELRPYRFQWRFRLAVDGGSGDFVMQLPPFNNP
ncbi:hypothetical protein [Teredinibacter sp. KSP-S5-2]|uniref:hypothetical protein n=1 Tax=Teredinibacter sp. KSP-S5-2 TaxID=3034506 RepID=UPI002934A35B|nr:hypothetical protein [Teredinibacter sp. KSP-S5-2]WNO11489.1 hypothetical protein P5V12_09925 [Teredinibacter sp. KSP-S5-2]